MSTTFFNNCYFERRWICISRGKGSETNKENFQRKKKKIMLSKNSIIKLLTGVNILKFAPPWWRGKRMEKMKKLGKINEKLLLIKGKSEKVEEKI